MVNKAVLSLAAIVLFAVFGTGVLVGTQIGGLGGGGPAETATESGPQATATPAEGDAPATATPTATPTEPSDDGPEPIPAREFNERNISVAIIENINDAREAEGLEPLSTTGTTAENVRAMASGHSAAMAEAGVARHTIDGTTSADRYRQNNLYETCQFQVASYIQDADNNALEVVGQTYAGQEYPDNGTQKFNENDTAVANALTEEWLSTQRQRLFYENAERIGAGVSITRTGTVYATVNVC
ncbi:CAP domain-containing protein [Haloarcula laminariae]|uniref:CAP domain-containing protein n=1 Tax=Haloarcula laminariae TaxID=2961577 RepID=UPI0021CAB9F8|nr:CAP domain-containing protein [Halomicroarcula laminariae]